MTKIEAFRKVFELLKADEKVFSVEWIEPDTLYEHNDSATLRIKSYPGDFEFNIPNAENDFYNIRINATVDMPGSFDWSS